jgi:hypothetical protein
MPRCGQSIPEQTLQTPVDALTDPERAPLTMLKRLTGRALIRNAILGGADRASGQQSAC